MVGEAIWGFWELVWVLVVGDIRQGRGCRPGKEEVRIRGVVHVDMSRRDCICLRRRMNSSRRV